VPGSATYCRIDPVAAMAAAVLRRLKFDPAPSI